MLIDRIKPEGAVQCDFFTKFVADYTFINIKYELSE